MRRRVFRRCSGSSRPIDVLSLHFFSDLAFELKKFVQLRRLTLLLKTEDRASNEKDSDAKTGEWDRLTCRPGKLDRN